MSACPATSRALRTSLGIPAGAAPTSARSTTSGSSTVRSVSKSPPCEAARKDGGLPHPREEMGEKVGGLAQERAFGLYAPKLLQEMTSESEGFFRDF